MNDVLSASAIAAASGAAARVLQIQVLTETGSTNADLLGQVERLQAPTLLLAEHQSAGRGRAGRSWHSAPQASLTFSLAWKFDAPLQALVGLPLAVGVALADGLAAVGVEVQLKWPNDVLYRGDKLAGILIETVSVKIDGVAAVWAVIGIGLNLAVPQALAAQIGRPAAQVPALARIDRNLLMATLLDSLVPSLTQFGQHGFAGVMARWNALHAYAGQTVTIQEREQILHQGVAAGVDASGCLLLDTDAGRVTVMAGDVSLRLQES